MSVDGVMRLELNQSAKVKHDPHSQNSICADHVMPASITPSIRAMLLLIPSMGTTSHRRRQQRTWLPRLRPSMPNHPPPTGTRCRLSISRCHYNRGHLLYSILPVWGKKDRRRSMLTCAWCQESYHTVCCRIFDKDPPLVFTCPSCCQLPAQVRDMSRNIMNMDKYLVQLTRTNQDLVDSIQTKDSQIEHLLTENSALREQISQLSRESQKLNWELMQASSNFPEKKDPTYRKFHN